MNRVDLVVALCSTLEELYFVEPPEELHGIPVQAAAHSASWAGWALNGTFSSADMAYIEPGDQGTACAGNAAVFWTGLGGLGHYPLVQDGTALNVPGMGQHVQLESGLSRYFEIEGRLREHSFYDGAFWDQLTLAVYRDTWQERAQRLIRAEQPPARSYRKIRVPADLARSR